MTVENRLVFLISMPRSGSTMLQRILDRSDEIATAGEPWIMLPLLSMYDDELIEARYEQGLGIRAKNALEQDLGLPGLAERSQRAYADSIYREILDQCGKRLFLDKTPRYVYIVDKLSALFPKAKYIVLTRNPAAVVCSYAETWKKGDYDRVLKDEAYCYDFQHGFPALSKFYASSFSNKLIVRYEDLVAQPDVEAERIFNYLDLNYERMFLDYGVDNELKRYEFGDPGTIYEKTRPDASHIDKWLKEIDTDEKRKGFLTCLNLIPETVFGVLDYDKDQAIAAIEEAGGRLEEAENQVSYGKELTKICICTPIFNGAKTIDRTIESIVQQEGCFLIRYHVQDGGSSDETLEKLKKWKKDIDSGLYDSEEKKVVFSYDSVPDNGMYDALVKGFRLLDCDDNEWMTWINSDDFLSKNSFLTLRALDRTEQGVDWVTGRTAIFDEHGGLQTALKPHFRSAIKAGLCDGLHLGFIQQEGTFWKGRLWKEVDGFSAISNFRLAGDWNLWRRFAEHAEIYVSERPLGYFCRRQGQLSEASSEDYYAEIENVVERSERLASLKAESMRNQSSCVVFIEGAQARIVEKSSQNYYANWLQVVDD